MHEAVDVGRLRRLDDFLVRGIQPPVADVVHDGAIEKHGILQHHAHLGAQRLARHTGDIVPVNENLTAV